MRKALGSSRLTSAPTFEPGQIEPYSYSSTARVDTHLRNSLRSGIPEKSESVVLNMSHVYKCWCGLPDPGAKSMIDAVDRCFVCHLMMEKIRREVAKETGIDIGRRGESWEDVKKQRRQRPTRDR